MVVRAAFPLLLVPIRRRSHGVDMPLSWPLSVEFRPAPAKIGESLATSVKLGPGSAEVGHMWETAGGSAAGRCAAQRRQVGETRALRDRNDSQGGTITEVHAQYTLDVRGLEQARRAPMEKTLRA